MLLSFLDDPALLIGAPLVAIGVAGIVVAAGAMLSYWLKPY